MRRSVFEVLLLSDFVLNVKKAWLAGADARVDLFVSTFMELQWQ